MLGMRAQHCLLFNSLRKSRNIDNTHLAKFTLKTEAEKEQLTICWLIKGFKVVGYTTHFVQCVMHNINKFSVMIFGCHLTTSSVSTAEKILQCHKISITCVLLTQKQESRGRFASIRLQIAQGVLFYDLKFSCSSALECSQAKTCF